MTKVKSQNLEIILGALIPPFVAIVMGIGLLGINTSCKPRVDPNSIHRVEKLSNCLEVKATNDISGRRVFVYNPQDNKDSNRYIGICALDHNRDGKFEEIYNAASKGSNLEQYVNLNKLEELYNHTAKFGADILPDGKK